MSPAVCRAGRRFYTSSSGRVWYPLSLRSSRTILIVRSSSFVVRSSILDSRFSSFRVLIVLRFSLSISILVVPRSSFLALDSRFSILVVLSSHRSSVVRNFSVRRSSRLPSWFGVWRVALYPFGFIVSFALRIYCFIRSSDLLALRSLLIRSRSGLLFCLSRGLFGALRHPIGSLLSSRDARS